MSPRASFSYIDGSRRIALTLELDGHTVVNVMTPEGETLETFQDEIDPRDATRLITELFDVVPNLTGRPDGELWVRLEQNGEVWDYSLSEYDLPHRGLDVGRIMRMIANDTLAGHQQRSPRKAGGPREARMTVPSFLGWALAFSAGYIGSMIVGWIGLFAGALIGPIAVSIAWTVSGLLLTGSFYTVGLKFGEHFRGAFPVWPVAIAGAAPLIYLYATLGGAASVFPILGMCAMPIFAHMGARMGY